MLGDVRDLGVSVLEMIGRWSSPVVNHLLSALDEAILVPLWAGARLPRLSAHVAELVFAYAPVKILLGSLLVQQTSNTGTLGKQCNCFIRNDILEIARASRHVWRNKLTSCGCIRI